MMKETIRISKIFQDLYNGSPWIDICIMDTLKNITAEQAAKKISPQCNTIWQIVHHLVRWREIELQRMQDKIVPSPADNCFIEIKDCSDAAWQKILQELETTQQQWINFLKTFNESDFEKVYDDTNSFSYYEHVYGVIQHDAYHLGQIVLLSKLV